MKICPGRSNASNTRGSANTTLHATRPPVTVKTCRVCSRWVPPGSGAFVFRDPRPGVLHGFVKGGVPNGHADVHLTPSDGLLVLFPCWMEHYVEPHDGDEPRITIAFNANPVDQEVTGRR